MHEILIKVDTGVSAEIMAEICAHFDCECAALAGPGSGIKADGVWIIKAKDCANFFWLGMKLQSKGKRVLG